MEKLFTLRFFKKVELYQQIKKSEGLLKNKRLWEQEKAILLWAYSERHQHLHSIPDYDTIKQIIADYKGINKQCVEEVKETIGNLLFKDFVEVTVDGKQIENHYLPYEDIKGARPTLLGIFAGEVLSEIENKNLLVRYFYIIKYELTIYFFWISLILISIKFILPRLFDFYFIPVQDFLVNQPFIIPAVIIIVWLFGKFINVIK